MSVKIEKGPEWFPMRRRMAAKTRISIRAPWSSHHHAVALDHGNCSSNIKIVIKSPKVFAIAWRPPAGDFLAAKEQKSDIRLYDLFSQSDVLRLFRAL